ncbi:MAG: M28 family peptidase [Planctomycetota bacterium]
MTHLDPTLSAATRRAARPALCAVALLLCVACSSGPVHHGPVTMEAHAAAATMPAAPAQAPVRVGGAPATFETDVALRPLIEAHMEFLASDELGGRETGTVHSEVTCRYVASAYRQAGLEPGGEGGSWFQHYPLEAQRVDLDSARFTFTRGDEARELELLDEWLLSGYGSEDIDLSTGTVFAGYGLVSESADVDDYEGLEVEGRLVLTISGRPEDRDDLRRAGNWRAKRAAARDRGALGLVQLVLADDADAERMIEFGRHRLTSPSMRVPDDEPADAWPMITVFGAAAHDLARAAGVEPGKNGAAPTGVAPRAVSDLQFGLAAAVETDRVEPSNVLGVIPGSDPALAHEFVVVSAHNDHVGILPDGRVNNGADDNASGTATIMTAATVLAAGPPMRRSVLFLSVSGEEKGLLGSEWWCEHPTVPLDDVVANINIDMVGRNDPAAVGATPSPEHEHYNTLVERAVELAPAAGLEVTWSAPKDGDDAVDNYYHRSDHYNFAQRGIPVVFFFSGIHEDYHRPSDELPKIQIDKLERMVRLLSMVVRDTADADTRPHGLQSAGR